MNAILQAILILFVQLAFGKIIFWCQRVKHCVIRFQFDLIKSIHGQQEFPHKAYLSISNTGLNKITFLSTISAMKNPKKILGQQNSNYDYSNSKFRRTNFDPLYTQVHSDTIPNETEVCQLKVYFNNKI